MTRVLGVVLAKPCPQTHGGGLTSLGAVSGPNDLPPLGDGIHTHQLKGYHWTTCHEVDQVAVIEKYIHYEDMD